MLSGDGAVRPLALEKDPAGQVAQPVRVPPLPAKWPAAHVWQTVCWQYPSLPVEVTHCTCGAAQDEGTRTSGSRLMHVGEHTDSMHRVVNWQPCASRGRRRRGSKRRCRAGPKWTAGGTCTTNGSKSAPSSTLCLAHPCRHGNARTFHREA